MQQTIQLLQGIERTVVIIAVLETPGHGAAYALPLFRRDAAAHVAVGDDIDLMFGQVDIDQHANVIFRIPHAILGEQFARSLAELKDVPAETLDGHEVRIYANLEFPHEVGNAIEHGALGIGLYRTEFLYTNDPDPSEEKHYQSYMEAVERLGYRARWQFNQ